MAAIAKRWRLGPFALAEVVGAILLGGEMEWLEFGNPV